MSSAISYKSESLWVSNARFSTLIDFALEIASSAANSADETSFVRKLRDDKENGFLFPGCSFDLDERFPEIAAKKFWAGVFFEVAQRIFQRRLGNQDIDTWQASAIADAHRVGRMLEDAVRHSDPNWLAPRATSPD